MIEQLLGIPLFEVNMNTLLIVGLMAIAPPTATDGYRANLNSVKVEADFNYIFGVYDWEFANKVFLSPPRGTTPVEKPAFAVDGTWGSDGKVERFFIPNASAERYKGLKTLEPFEALFDGETFAAVADRQTDVAVTKTNTSPLNLLGPFEWWRSPLSQIIDTEYSGINPKTHDIVWQEVKCKYNSFVSQSADSWQKLELYYDPASGFVPRFGRIVAFDGKLDTLYIKDVHILNVAQCRAGGFFPKEWIDRSFSVNNMSRKKPGFSPTVDSLDLVASSRVVLGHFRVSSHRDTNQPVSLHLGPNVKVLGAKGGFITNKLRNPSMNDLKNALGKRLDANSPQSAPKLNIDESDRREGQPQANNNIYRAFGFGLISLASIGVLYHRGQKRRSLLTFIPLMFFLPGCGSKDPVAPKISIHFTKPLLWCEPNVHSLDDELVVENNGNTKLRLQGIDGGCSCRSIDKSAFPFELSPGDVKSIPIALSRKGDYQIQDVLFQVKTDSGMLLAPAKIQILPRLKLIPDSYNVVLSESDSIDSDASSFIIKVREVSYKNSEKIPYIMPQLSGLTITPVPEINGENTVDVGDDYKISESAFRVSVSDRSLGLKKELIQLLHPDGHALTESSIIWHRKAFLSATPSQILLTDQQVRVFLHSSDETISFVRILSVPKGVKAQLVSSNELIVSKDKDVPSNENGDIKIETSSAQHSLLTVGLFHIDKM